jgi:uncharacterized membrane protein
MPFDGDAFSCSGGSVCGDATAAAAQAATRRQARRIRPARIRRKVADPSNKPSSAKLGRGFRWRGREVTRLEGFTDAVFAFAVTLLVVSLEVPKTFNDLAEAMRGFLAFAICFAMLVWIWHEHSEFFRRYGLQDSLTVWLNAVLIFVVLFYVYPLKFLFTLVVNQFTGRSLEVARPGGRSEPMIADHQVRSLFVVYGAGIIAIFLVLAFLYAHAYRRRRELELTQVEAFDTRWKMIGHLVPVFVGGVSICLALFLPLGWMAVPGFIYALLGPLFAVHGSVGGKLRRQLQAKFG